jgi:general stress protein 26
VGGISKFPFCFWYNFSVDKKQFIHDFIKKHKIAVISTVNSGNQPESAVLEFGETHDLELIFDTHTSSRKFKNIQKHPNVSFVIGWDENITVQYQGVAKEVTGDQAKKYKEAYWSKNPEAERWEEREGITYFKVEPKWIRYSDLNEHPWHIFEITM